jgi:hypothetical protein
MASTNSAFVLIHPADNILVCCRPAVAGDSVKIDGVSYTLTQAITVGHKISRQELAVGDSVIKYGASIGSMTSAAEPAQHIHNHNLISDYLQSHTREEFGGEGLK